MAKVIPPKSFFKLSKEQQVEEAVRQMNKSYEDAEAWKRLAQQARKSHVIDEEIDRPDILAMKDH